MTTAAIVVIGKENVGKSLVIRALTGAPVTSMNMRGSTVACETYIGTQHTFIDTPGIHRATDLAQTAEVLAQVTASDAVLLVAQATHADDDLRDLLPLAAGKRGVVALTFWDKLPDRPQAMRMVERLRVATGMACIPLDARAIPAVDATRLVTALTNPPPLVPLPSGFRTGWRIDAPEQLLGHRHLGPALGLLLLLLPALLAVWCATRLAGLADPLIQQALGPVVTWGTTLPSLLGSTLTGRYGILTMGVLLVVWALPTILIYALLLAMYKTSGLLERITSAVHPLTRPIGLSGRDLVRVVMGFGCNVPAIINTRACSTCSRATCMSIIAFGSACSYQFSATLAVFAAAGRSQLIWPYLAYLTMTTLIYARLIAPPAARAAHNPLVLEQRVFLQWPQPQAVWAEVRSTLGQFARQAVPIFVLITLVASVLEWLGALAVAEQALTPLMSLFNLPAHTALAVVMGSIRKDGLVLFAEGGLAQQLSSIQLLTGVYLAGVLLPCFVTVLTIAREQSWRFAVRLVLRQAAAAAVFALLLAWVGHWMHGA